ncbi:MAG: FN3 domain-containing metallophosphoesterase family protein [Propionibacteriaceae bacterium]|nr:FN3 domain-containing metallophosphoesterase family protein [Propionibacteriaceae bacterium]
MRKRWSVLRALAAVLLGIGLVLGTFAQARAATQYSSIVLNVGATESERNLVWYADSAGDQVVELAVKGQAATTTRTVAPVTSGPAAVAGHTYHQATLDNLAPQTTYAYRVGSATDGWSSTYEFTTGGTAGFDFLMYGDPQMGSGGGIPTDAAAWANTLETSLTRVPGADFLMTTGDQVNTAGSETEYAEFLASDRLRSYPLATNIGNHDNGSVAYGQHFFMPNTSTTAGTAGTPIRPGLGNYWRLYNGVLFLSFNTNNRDDAAHFAWAQQVIAEHGASATWRVASLHHGVYSTASHADDRDIIERRATWPVELSKLNVDVVIGGHDHVYSRSHLINQGHAVGDVSAPATLAKFPGESLWLTLNSGSGSKYYAEMAIDFPFNAVSKQARVPSYTHAEVTADAFRLVTYELDGAVTDDVTLTKAPAGATPNPVPAEPPVVDFWGDGSILTGLGDKPIANVTDPSTGLTTVEARILRPNDDVEEYVLTKRMYLDSSDLELAEERPTSTTDKESQLIGLRFDAVAIPAGARIQSAHLQFTVDEPNKSVGAADLTIAVENTDHAAPYLSADGNVSGRTYLGQTVSWLPAEWPTAQVAGPDQRTPDLTTLVQSVVDRPDWFRGNAMAFTITGSGARTAEAYEGGLGAEAPKLLVTYSMGERTELEARITQADDDVEQYLVSGLMDHGSSDLEITQEREDQLIGLRYPNLQIPAGAEITQAFVQFTTDEPGKSADPFAVKVYAEAADNSAPFGTEAYTLSQRTKTATGVEWGAGVPLWTLEQEQRHAQRTTDIRAAIQEVVDRPGWQAGNALSLLIEGNGNRTAESFEGGGAAEAPALVIVYAMKAEEPQPVDLPISNLDKHEFTIDTTGLPAGAKVTLTVVDKNHKTKRILRVPAGRSSVVRVTNWVTVEAVATVDDEVVGTGSATSPHRELKKSSKR